MADHAGRSNSCECFGGVDWQPRSLAPRINSAKVFSTARSSKPAAAAGVRPAIVYISFFGADPTVFTPPGGSHAHAEPRSARERDGKYTTEWTTLSRPVSHFADEFGSSVAGWRWLAAVARGGCRRRRCRDSARGLLRPAGITYESPDPEALTSIAARAGGAVIGRTSLRPRNRGRSTRRVLHYGAGAVVR
jgi:hypothetical protein